MIQQRAWVRHPLEVVAAGTAAAVAAVVAAAPIRDEDLWWHVLIGEEIVDSRSIQGLGNTWAPFGDQNWVTTQWLSETGYAAAHDLGGWSTITALRVLVAVTTLLMLALLLRRGRPSTAWVPVYVVTALGLALWLSRDRPQTLVLPLAVVLAGWMREGLRDRYPPWWVVPLLTVPWANLHGSWVVVPSVWALVVVARATDSRRLARQPLLLALMGLLSGLVTPAGIDGVLAIARFTEHTEFIIEWQPTAPLTSYGLMLLMLVIMIVSAWAHPPRVPWFEIVTVLALAGFGFLAIRNVPLALILLAPVAADRLSAVMPQGRSRGVVELRVLTAMTIAVLTLGAVVASLSWSRVDPLADPPPLSLARHLPAGSLVLSDYSTGGFLAQFGPVGTQVVIDGRADRYEPAFQRAYLDAVYRLVDWQGFLRQTDPDVAALLADTALATQLQSSGWQLDAEVDGYVVLRPARSGETP